MDKRQSEFENLLDRYLNGNASHEQQTRLFKFIISGDFDEYLANNLLESLKKEAYSMSVLPEPDRLNQLYKERIRSQMEHQQEASIPIPTPNRQRSTYWFMAAAVACILLTLGIWTLAPESGKTPEVLSQQARYTEVYPKDDLMKYVDKQMIILPDGSTVLLNDDATLTYRTDSFGTEVREVTLEGEAFFNIFPDKNKQFVVLSRNVKTTVLGTAFNIKAIPGNDEVEVTVERGKVSVGNIDKTYEMLTADQQLTVNTTTNTFQKRELKSVVATEWKENFLIFDDVTMGEVAQKITEKFGVTLSFKNDNLKNCHVTAPFLHEEGLDHILEVISTIHGFDYAYVNDGADVVISGNSGCD
jgi:transmembrane sensor